MLLADVKSKIAFEPVPIEPVPMKGGAEWRVRATLPSGKQVHLGDFKSEAEANEWITLKSSEWGGLRECQRRLFGVS